MKLLRLLRHATCHHTASSLNLWVIPLVLAYLIVVQLWEEELNRQRRTDTFLIKSYRALNQLTEVLPTQTDWDNKKRVAEVMKLVLLDPDFELIVVQHADRPLEYHARALRNERSVQRIHASPKQFGLEANTLRWALNAQDVVVIHIYGYTHSMTQGTAPEILYAPFLLLLIGVINFRVVHLRVRKSMDLLQEQLGRPMEPGATLPSILSRDAEIKDFAEDFLYRNIRVQRQLRYAEVLNRAASELSNTAEQTELSQTLFESLRRLLPVERCAIFLWDAETERLHLRSVHPHQGESLQGLPSFEVGHSLIGLVAKQRRTLFIPDSSKDIRFLQENPLSNPPRSVLFVPMMDEQELYGVMSVAGPVGELEYAKEDRNFVLALARFAVSRLRNLRQLETIEDYSRTLEQKVIKRTEQLQQEKLLSEALAMREREARRVVQELLDNSGEGFLSFDAQFKIWPEYSRACETFLGPELAGKDALEALFGHLHAPETDLTEDVPDLMTLRQMLDLVFTGAGKLKQFRAFFPREVQYGERTATLHYYTIRRRRRTERILVVIHDITREKQLRKQMDQDEERTQLILKAFSERELFFEFVKEQNRLFTSIQKLLQPPLEQKQVHSLIIQFHTIKGNSSYYGMRRVSEQAHQTETFLEEQIAQVDRLGDAAVHEVRKRLKQIQQDYQAYLDELQKLMPEDSTDESQRQIRLHESVVERWHEGLAYVLIDKPFEMMQAEVGTQEEMSEWRTALRQMQQYHHDLLQQAVEFLVLQPIEPYFRKFENIARTVAKKLGKEVQVEVRGSETRIPYARWSSVLGALVHVVNNLVDHGIEEATVRERYGKRPEGSLRFGAEQVYGAVALQFADDGRGIDPNRIGQLALERGIIEEPFLRNATEQEIVELIFLPGFSSRKDEVSETSGRGVGLEAVRQAVLALNGTIHIHSEVGSGTRFEMKIPVANQFARRIEEARRSH